MNAQDRRQGKSAPASAPPEVSTIDASWDDDTVPGLDLDDPLNEFDRVTAIPDLPSELYAKKVMASVDESRAPELPSEPPGISVRPLETGEFSLDTPPPPASRGRPPYAPSPTGLELADLSFDSISSLKAEPPRATATARGRDPRD